MYYINNKSVFLKKLTFADFEILILSQKNPIFVYDIIFSVILIARAFKKHLFRPTVRISSKHFSNIFMR